MEFKKRETMFGVSWVCEGPPFAAIRPNGGIYLSGDYTLEQLAMIMMFAANLSPISGSLAVDAKHLLSEIDYHNWDCWSCKKVYDLEPVLGEKLQHCPYCGADPAPF